MRSPSQTQQSRPAARAASSFFRSCAISPSANSDVHSAVPVRAMLIPAPETSPSRVGGAFERQSGKTLRPPATSAPAASIFTVPIAWPA
jgi:hypothetical protein